MNRESKLGTRSLGNFYMQNALRVKLAEMGDEIMQLWKQLDIGQDEQV